ncbi:hypothetical protein [Sphingobium ummariense]|uniref:hypothetical protein n=1 Tax=Sphingobium ummariense TaxID=420994 RepID=UPI0012695D9D|nr:hypothetical protein [Sphingobium ummariense]
MPNAIILSIATLAGLVAYIALPALLATACKHPERALIYKLSPLTLLSFILWLVLVAWAFTGRRDDAVIARHVTKLRENKRLPSVIVLLVLFGLAGSLIPLVH